MQHAGEKIGFASLANWLTATPIDTVYLWLDYDYAQEAGDDETKRLANAKRKRFLELFSWRSDPTSEIVRRLFNQINTFYAERALLSSSNPAWTLDLLETNRLSLFRQGKTLGLRRKAIAFGYRNHLDFMDPFRRSKWLCGISPAYLEEAVDNWARSAAESPPDLDAAIFLSMALIAIHPFSDANGRVARLVFTALCQRWNVGPLWLGEGRDGELLRTGHGTRGTEYLMGMFVIKLVKGCNVIDPGGFQDSSAPEQMIKALNEELNNIRSGSPQILKSPEFINLKDHLVSEHHLRRTSPRFDCLREALL